MAEAGGPEVGGVDARTLLANYLASRGLPPTGANVSAALNANAQNPGTVPGLENMAPVSGQQYGPPAPAPALTPATGVPSSRGGGGGGRSSTRPLPIPPVPPGVQPGTGEPIQTTASDPSGITLDPADIALSVLGLLGGGGALLAGRRGITRGPRETGGSPDIQDITEQVGPPKEPERGPSPVEDAPASIRRPTRPVPEAEPTRQATTPPAPKAETTQGDVLPPDIGLDTRPRVAPEPMTAPTPPVTAPRASAEPTRAPVETPSTIVVQRPRAFAIPRPTVPAGRSVAQEIVDAARALRLGGVHY